MRTLKDAFLKLMNIVSKIELLVSEVLLAALIVATVIGTLTRYFLGKPFTWMEEFQLACVVWIVFVAAAVAFHERAHVAIEMVVDLFPRRVQDVINILIGIVVLFTLGYLFKQALRTFRFLSGAEERHLFWIFRMRSFTELFRYPVF